MKHNNPCHFLKLTLLLIAATSLDPAISSAAPSLSVRSVALAPGAKVLVAIDYTSDTNAPTLQFDLLYSTTYLASGDPMRGNALSDHSVASAEPSPGVRRVVIFSGSNHPITNGVLVYVPFTLAANAPDHDEPLRLSNVVVANPQADLVPSNTTDGILALAVPPRFSSIYRTKDGIIHLQLAGSPGRRYSVESTRTVGQSQWLPLYTNVASDGVLLFDDVGAAGLTSRFYRALVVP
jgi:hypothetical protein